MVTARSNFNRFPAAFISLFLLAITAVAAFAETPIVSGQVVTENGITRYIYTVTNTLAAGCYIYRFGNTEIPDGNILSLLSHSEPIGWDYQEGQEISNGVVIGGEYHWTTGQFGSARLASGQSAVLEVYTSAPVTTQWTNNWTVDIQPDGACQHSFCLDTALPIPVAASVPEPSSILALLGGIAGIGGFALRRRK